MLKRVLIANRGEIALRIIRACRELGIETVAVYSNADRLAPFARRADLAFEIGPAPAAESYLNQDRIIETALHARADAIHPGYGFLAENPVFAQRVLDAGLVWIGPPPHAIRTMGDKLEARRIMSAAGVPLVTGIERAASDLETVAAACDKIGYPVLIKAAAGGGGKGMRIVHSAAELASNLTQAASEAERAFADPRVYIEKYLEQPRHIEIQIFADRHGNIVHLGERECSIQRRYQKVIEESPSPIVDTAMREAMGAAAIKAACECGYESAGTVEFLVDRHRNFFFLEMNTRLQVEHPVTEMVYGIDLVAAQLRIASGEKLWFSQSDVRPRGHAIECRIYAEDTDNNFLPSTGKLTHYAEPSGPGVRVDSGVEEGFEVSVYYDPQLAKLIVWGEDRETARTRMLRALDEYHIVGVKHNIPALRQVIDHPAFIRGDVSTHFVQDHKLPQPHQGTDDEFKLAAVAAAIFAARRARAIHVNGGIGAPQLAVGINRPTSSAWRLTGRPNALRGGPE
jgi:acetyl-CoA carboxylase biotin carboxylase subunit